MAWPTSHVATVQPRAAGWATPRVVPPSSAAIVSVSDAVVVTVGSVGYWQRSPVGISPVRAMASARASASHCAYAVGAPLRCTDCAATVTGSLGQFGTAARCWKNAVAA